MKRLVPTGMLVIAFLLYASCSYASAEKPQKARVMHDPIFGITYLPSKVKFEQAPAEIYRCKDLREPRSILWLFGKVVKEKVTFYYVYGLLEVDFGAGPTGEFEAANDSGIIVVLTPSGCREIGAGYALSPDPQDRKMAFDLGITDEVLTALLADLVDREVKAFGGVSNFLAKVSATGISESDLEPPVRAQLQALRNKAKATTLRSTIKTPARE